MIRFLVILIFTFAAFVSSHTLYLYTHRTFGPNDFNHPLVLNRPASSSVSKEEAHEILKQRFTYLGFGGQMTAYESEDKQYVLKFFNPRSVINKTWFHRLPKLMRINSLKWIINTYFHQKQRLEKYFDRYSLSYKDLKDETGLVYIHVDPATTLPGTVEVIAKEGTSHHLKLAPCPFVLQKKAEDTIDYLSRLHTPEEIEEAARQIYALFESRAKKGYTDQYQALDGNFGFINKRFIQFDTGRIKKSEAVLKNPHKEVARVIGNIKPHLSKYPELINVLENCLQSQFP